MRRTGVLKIEAVRPEGRTAGKIQSTFNKKPLQVETNAEFVNLALVLNIGTIGGQEVEIDLETRREDEPAALCTDGNIAAEFIEAIACGQRLVESKVESRSNTQIPAMVVVFIDVGELEGQDNRAVGTNLFLTIESNYSCI